MEWLRACLQLVAYELSKKEKKVGTPERPLSDLGLLSYRSYWTHVILKLLRDHKSVSIQELSDMTAIQTEDIIRSVRLCCLCCSRLLCNNLWLTVDQCLCGLRAAPCKP